MCLVSSLSAFMISKTHKYPKPRGRQLNAKVCDCESAIFHLVKTTMFNKDISKMVQVITVILSQNWSLSQCGALQPLSIFIATNSPWSIKLCLALPGCCPLDRTPFSIEEIWFALHKRGFQDAVALRYDWTPLQSPTYGCGTKFSIEHAFSYPKGGFHP